MKNYFPKSQNVVNEIIIKLNKNKINKCIYNCLESKNLYFKINNKFELVRFNPI